MIYKHLEQKCYKIKSGGVALGMTKNVHKLLKEREISFEPNDVIILYSDGITEAIDKPKRDGTENMFGEDLLVRVIEESPNIGKHEIKTARSIFKNISIALSKFMGYKFVQLDDVTLVTIQYESPQYVQADDCSEEM
jgi:serine phosphatase RsbU (regulator of sigma subunit)